MNSDLRTAAALVQDIAEEEAAVAYDALSVDVQELREEVAGLRREILTFRCSVLVELERLREGLG